MEASFWHERWVTGQTGFHEGRPNALLAKHARLLEGRRRVLVPLAGKAHDMIFLWRRAHDVVGVEVVELACRQFFEENQLPHAVEERDAFRAFILRDELRAAQGERSDGIELLCGNIFDATPDRVGRVDAVYDRAALVALDPATRRRYVETLAALLPPRGRMLLVTFAYDQSLLPGPPWSVDGDEVRALFSDLFEVKLLEERPAEAGPRFAQAGVTSLTESITLLTRR